MTLCTPLQMIPCSFITYSFFSRSVSKYVPSSNNHDDIDTSYEKWKECNKKLGNETMQQVEREKNPFSFTQVSFTSFTQHYALSSS